MNRKIMIVDDNPDLIYMVKKRLEKMPDAYGVIGAHSAMECFELLKNGELPDLILLDIMMPEINGWDLFTKLKETPAWRKIPIVFLTAKTDPYSKGFGKVSAHDYVCKPFEIGELKEKIDKILNDTV
jgi:CheY-like chemotaxis protein